MFVASLIFALFASKRVISVGLGGTCNTTLLCDDHLECFYRNGCDPDCGHLNCGGICLEPDCNAEYDFCGGFPGFPCDFDSTCLDTAGDSCSPNCEGADCGGTCVLNSAIGQPCENCIGLGLLCGICPDGVNNFGYCGTCVISDTFQCVPEVLTCPPQVGDSCCGCAEPECACTLCPDGVNYAGCCGECVIDEFGDCSYSGITQCPEPLACTADAFQCPDGSFVGRDPYNNCEFEKCCCPPNENPLLCFEGCACCADGTWSGSIGDGQTFTCGGQSVNINDERDRDFFSEECETTCLDNFDRCLTIDCANVRGRGAIITCIRNCLSK